MAGEVRTNRPGRLGDRMESPRRAEELSRSARRTKKTRHDEPSYYDVSILKSPVWKWEIASYFFLGGMSAGAYLLARLANRVGGPQYKDLTRAGTYLTLASFLPCPPLLIHDLGDPKRFHHMLRVFKPGSPMSLGTWTIVGYSGMAAAAALREYMGQRHWPDGKPPTPLLRAADKALLLLHDAAGIPLALLVAGYTGVLLNSTANPLWSKNAWLGPLFSASAMSTGAAGISLALDLFSSDPEVDSPSHEALEKVDTAAHLAEIATLAGFLTRAGPKAKSLTHGAMKHHLCATLGGILGAEILKFLPFSGRRKRRARIVGSLLGLAAGFSLRWAMVYGGHEAADDPHTARLASKK